MRLGIDTTNNNLCIALCDHQKILFAENIYPFDKSAEQLAPKIKSVLQDHNITVADLSDVVSVTGPGGFSGVRIGTSFVTGFTFQTNINVIAISSLDALAYSVESPIDNSLIVACLNARREGVYIAVYDHHYQKLTQDSVVNISELDQFLKPFLNRSFYLAGHGSHFLEDFLDMNLLQGDMLQTSLAENFTRRAVSSLEHTPFYLRDPDAKLPTKKPKI